MLTKAKIKEMCIPPEKGKAYYRPVICKGNLQDVDIFFVGTNPATPIFPNEIDIDSYVELLMDYEKFIHYYKTSRLRSDKTEISRTRIGMNSFLNWLSSATESSIAETEIIPYPTENLKLLRKEPDYIVDRAKDIFYQLLMEFNPKLVILHGKETVEQTVELFASRGIIGKGAVDIDQPIEDMEKRAPLFQFTYLNGKVGAILACRHFMYYGTKGESFAEFRSNVMRILSRQGNI
jgi:hypothetical protein